MSKEPDGNLAHWMELLRLITEARMAIVAAQTTVHTISERIHVTERNRVGKILDALATQALALDGVGFHVIRDLRSRECT